jgi:protein-S-isoprenylcysteine O-methyltransferase Ste14/SAM-dependent methyltransferase
VSDQIRFDDGAAYERFMGRWSQLAGEAFIDWLAPAAGLRWLDVGCGNGAFTEILIGRCAPVSVHGVDPSEGQLAYARARPGVRAAQFQKADALALPFPDGTFDAAVMPLVIFFVPDPAKGVAEMARVACPGATVSAYAWDMFGGGFPYEALHAEMRGLGLAVAMPPSPDASRIDAMRLLWAGAGLSDIETTEITVRRTYDDFDDYWETLLGGPSVAAKLAATAPADREELKARMRARLPVGAAGAITCVARANAVKGRVPSRSPASDGPRVRALAGAGREAHSFREGQAAAPAWETLLRHLLAIAVLPLTVVVLIPAWIARHYAAAISVGPSTAALLQAGGGALLVLGALLAAASVWRFASEGKGTLAPWDPPPHFVARGPYQYVRNPMISGVILVLFGESLVLGSPALATWALLFLILNLLYIPLVEEPELEKRFGDAYREYCGHVRRFIPRTRPWRAGP